MPATTGIVPDIADSVTVPKKTVIPTPLGSPPKTGQIWPRGSKAAGN